MLLDQIRGRRDVTVEQMLMALDMVPAADIESRRPLLAIASRGLADPRVTARWIELASQEQDPAMIERVAALDFRQIPDLRAYARLMVAGGMLGAVARLAAIPDVAVELMQPSVLPALAHAELSEPLVKWLLTILDQLNPQLKLALMRRDALPPEVLRAMLSEPAPIRRQVLQYAADRGIDLGDALRDPDADCRLDAARCAAPEKLIEAARSDPDPRVREAALLALDMTPEAARAIVVALRTEKSLPLVRLMLELLAPHTSEIRDDLIALLRESLQAEIAAEIYAMLGRLVAWDDALLEAFVRAYEVEREDRVRAAILQALAGVPHTDARLVRLYLDALRSPVQAIRDWGLAGIVMLPMSEENLPSFVEAASALQLRVDFNLKRALAKKLARMPSKPSTVLAALRNAAEHDDDLREICERVSDSVDWEQWYRRVEVERRADGIFPDIYLHYDENPAAARRILKAALNPNVNLYGAYGYDVSTGSILTFLAGRDAVDDDVSLICVNRLLAGERENHDWLLTILKSNPSFPGLRDALRAFIASGRKANPLLLRELGATDDMFPKKEPPLKPGPGLLDE